MAAGSRSSQIGVPLNRSFLIGDDSDQYVRLCSMTRTTNYFPTDEGGPLKAAFEQDTVSVCVYANVVLSIR